ncbi:MAG: hypothetical protein DMD38_05970 [Gemmatimonadetes bacterium]|nr:MAG: hypothetical protein AUI86_03900 [Gemmatimonadetes bacterium 13_1_40CM_3_66_12]OLD85803.1 MAG: hypothetical protein AUG85_12290 [Gemmatimonadetes bacterium 13_1_20CM_4_66_11]PYP97216.1 MAG: hypothetical protein DMD38_05970 [Gemmatimonadota bacterium]
MPKGPSKSAAAIERLLEERRQYEAWLARITATADSAPEHVRTRVKADYEARLKAVTEELRAHADAARQLIAQRKETLLELQKKEKAVAERLAETELRHEVGEYDEAQWGQVHKDALADLGAVRDELMDVERDITRLEELDKLVKAKPTPASRGVAGELTLTPSPPLKPAERRKTPIDELAFLKSVTEDDKNAPSPRRASGGQYQPDDLQDAAHLAPVDEDAPVEKTLKCRECGTMNLATEWYCENCGAEMGAL